MWHMNWHLWIQALNSLKVFGMCGDEDLDQKCMHLLMEINNVMLFPSRGVSIFGQDLVLTMQESSTL